MLKQNQEAITNIRESEWNRFWSFVQKSDGCWLWTGSRFNGYGQFVFRSRKILAHRFIYRAKVGPIDAGHQVDHLCRERSCVNPVHLEAVTQLENLRRSRSTVLTPADIQDIYSLTDHGLMRVEIAGLFGMSQVHISRVVLGYVWRDIYLRWKAASDARA